MRQVNLEKLFKTFVSKDESKPALMGVWYDKENNKLAGCDGHRGFILGKVSDQLVIEGPNCILPVEIFTEYMKRAKGHSLDYCNEYIKLVVNDNFVELQQRASENKPFKTFYGADCINENYPDIYSVVPARSEYEDTSPSKFGVNPKYMGEIWAAIKPSVDKYHFPVIHITSGHSYYKPLILDFPALDEDSISYDCFLMPVNTEMTK